MPQSNKDHHKTRGRSVGSKRFTVSNQSSANSSGSRKSPGSGKSTPGSGNGNSGRVRSQTLPASGAVPHRQAFDSAWPRPRPAPLQPSNIAKEKPSALGKDRLAANATLVAPVLSPVKPKVQDVRVARKSTLTPQGKVTRGTVKFKQLAEEYAVGHKVHGYQVTRAEEVPGLNIFAIYLTHLKTGALHLHLASNDTENVFSAGFRTTPHDSTGVAHVLEHTVLCGSEKYPVRGTFFKMLTRSLATFMNAITGSDYTIYPFATQNRTDFYNMLSVYLDAVFKPLLTEHDFMQEGWRLEPKDLENPSSCPYEIKGVVYNEMKAIFALPHEELQRKIRNAILPSHTYGNVSGGDPLDIPRLKYRKLLEFHRHHYHPSNARFYTYGDLPLAEHLKFIDQNYLKNYQKIDPKTEVPMEPKWPKPRKMQLFCEPEAVAQKSHAQTTVTVTYLLEPVSKLFLSTCFQILEELLINGPNAPFYHTLIESRLGSDYAPQSGYYGSTKQGYFTVGLKNCKLEDVDRVVKLIDGTFSWLANEGFDNERLQGIVHGMELSLRHEPQNFGIKLLMFLAPVWGHVRDPIDNLIMFSNFRQTFEEQYEKNPNLLKELIRRHFVENQHRLIAIMTPRTDPADTYAAREKANIEKMVSKMSLKEKEMLAARIKKFNQTQNDKEDCACLPLLKLSEIEPSTFRIRRVKSLIFGVPFQATPQATNGITYFRCVVASDHLPPALKMYLPLYCLIITKMGFTGMDFHDGDSSPARAGGFSASPFVSENPQKPGEYEEGVIFYSFSMNRNTNFMFHVWTKIFQEQNFADPRRLGSLIRLETSRLVNHIGSTGHVMALWHSASSLTPSGRAAERYSGFHFVNFMTKLAKDISDSHHMKETVRALEQVSKQIMNRNRMRCALNTTENHMQTAKYFAAVFLSNVKGSPSPEWHHFVPHSNFRPKTKKTHILVPLPLNSTAKSFPAVHFCHKDYAPLRVLTELMSWKYLMKEVRDKGGAYGTGALLQTTGVFTLYSHRDPRGFKTFQVYKKGLEWILSDGSFGLGDIHEAKLAVFQSVDAPVPPSNKGINFFINGYDEDLLNEHRSAIIGVTIDDVKRVTKEYLKEVDVFGECIIGPQVHNAELAEHFQIKHLK